MLAKNVDKEVVAANMRHELTSWYAIIPAEEKDPPKNEQVVCYPKPTKKRQIRDNP